MRVPQLCTGVPVQLSPDAPPRTTSTAWLHSLTKEYQAAPIADHALHARCRTTSARLARYQRLFTPSDHLSFDTDDADHATARGTTAPARPKHSHGDVHASPPR